MTISNAIPFNVLAIGDLWETTISVPNYPASNGYVLEYVLKKADVLPITITATQDTVDLTAYKISVPSATNSTYLPGKYQIAAYIYDGAKRYTIAISEVELLPDLFTSIAAYDPRSYNKKCLDILEGVLTGTLERDVLETTFKDTTFKYRNPMEIMKLKEYFQRLVDAENGILPGRRILKQV